MRFAPVGDIGQKQVLGATVFGVVAEVLLAGLWGETPFLSGPYPSHDFAIGFVSVLAGAIAGPTTYFWRGVWTLFVVGVKSRFLPYPEALAVGAVLAYVGHLSGERLYELAGHVMSRAGRSDADYERSERSEQVGYARPAPTLGPPPMEPMGGPGDFEVHVVQRRRR